MRGLFSLTRDRYKSAFPQNDFRITPKTLPLDGKNFLTRGKDDSLVFPVFRRFPLDPPYPLF
jgi:hypothetical protein